MSLTSIFNRIISHRFLIIFSPLSKHISVVMEESKKMDFPYSSADFHYTIEKEDHSKNVEHSVFDQTLRSKWDHAMEEGHFRYDLSEMKSRIIPGKYNFVLQLNLKRGVERRAPQYIDKLSMPFDPSKFNFTKVKEGEILFYLCPKATENLSNGVSPDHHHNGIVNGVSNGVTNGLQSEEDHYPVMINVSPLEYGHILIVPDINKQLPQQLTYKSIKAGLEMALLSSDPGFRVGFNSLCALASVNHLHLHAWYVDEEIYNEKALGKEIYDGMYDIFDGPVKGFIFQLYNSSVDDVTRKVYTVTSYLQRNDIAHNMMITRGDILGGKGDSNKKTLRVFVWPRKSVIGVKNETGEYAPFNIAVAELGGHIPMYVAEAFDVITEEHVLKMFEDNMLSDEVYTGIKEDIVQLLKKPQNGACNGHS